jgi:asparagine synthase (glutamine-hydrolysing)
LSAIVGVFHRDDQPVDEQVVKRMTAALAHRGPDGSGVWTDTSIGLGHLMLHTTPESLSESQPVVHRDRGLAVTADARIDNRDELIAALGLCARGAGPITDSELILAAYERWETDCPDRLIGDFAFAVWDREKRRLFCARDPVGVKPFYFHAGSRVFAFASEIKALLGVPGVPRKLNELQVAYYLEGVLEDTEITFYEGIMRLPAAHWMVVTAGGLHRSKYWDLDAVADIRYGSDQEYADAFRAHFTEAVRSRLRSARPVGAALSGGLDSSSIVCTARRLLEESGRLPLDSYSAIFPGLPEEERRIVDERGYMEAVIVQGGLRPHFVEADRLSPLTDMDRVAWHHDQAPLGYNLYMSWGLYAEAQRQGTRVYLDGFGGDEAMGGLALFPLFDYVREGEWESFATEVRLLKQRSRAVPRRILTGIAYPRLRELARRGEWRRWREGADQLSTHFGARRWKLALQCGLVPRVVPERVFTHLAARRQPSGEMKLINRAFARRVRLRRHLKALESGRETPVAARQMLQKEYPSPLTEYVMEMADKLAAAFEQVLAYPYFDRRLIEFCIAIPAAQQVRDGLPRSLVRRAMEGILPPEVQWRPGKQNLAPNFERGMRERDRALIEQTLGELLPSLGDYVDVSTVRAAQRRFFADGAAAAAPLDSSVLYHTVVLGRWLVKEFP